MVFSKCDDYISLTILTSECSLNGDLKKLRRLAFFIRKAFRTFLCGLLNVQPDCVSHCNHTMGSYAVTSGKSYEENPTLCPTTRIAKVHMIYAKRRRVLRCVFQLLAFAYLKITILGPTPSFLREYARHNCGNH